jgi:hypothetical protein
MNYIELSEVQVLSFFPGEKQDDEEFEKTNMV